MRSVSDKPCRETQNKHFVCSNLLFFIFFENRAVYEIMWKNTVEMGRPQMTMWCMRIACWMPKATNTHSECVIYILLFYCHNGCTKAPQCCIIVHSLSCYKIRIKCYLDSYLKTKIFLETCVTNLEVSTLYVAVFPCSLRPNLKQLFVFHFGFI